MKFWLFFAKIINFWLFFANFSKFMAIFRQIFEIFGYFPPNFWIFGYFPPKFRNFWPFSAKILKLPSKFTQPTTRRVPGYPIASTRVRNCNTRAYPGPDFWYPNLPGTRLFDTRCIPTYNAIKHPIWVHTFELKYPTACSIEFSACNPACISACLNVHAYQILSHFEDVWCKKIFKVWQ